MLSQSYSRYAKRDIGVFIFYCVIFFLLSNLPIITSLSRTSGNFDINVTAMSVLFVNSPLHGVVVASSIIEAFRQFGYLHNRSQADFFCSLPVNRTHLFLTRYFTGILFIMVPFTANVLIGMIISLAAGLSGKYVLYLLLGILVEFVFFNMYYGILVFLMITTGKAIAYVCGVIGANVIGPALLYAITIVFVYPFHLLDQHNSQKIYAVSTAVKVLQYLVNSSPIALYIRISTHASQIFYIYSDSGREPIIDINLKYFIKYMPTIACYIVIFFISAFQLYKRLRNENCGKALTFTKSERPLQIFVTIISGILIGSIFADFSYVSMGADYIFNYIIFTVISVFIVHTIFEIAYTGDFKKIFRHKWQLLICILAAFICSAQPIILEHFVG